jgi:hypothetical protein
MKHLNSLIILSLQLPRQKLFVTFSGGMVPKASVTTSAFENVWQFLVIKVQTIPLMFAHFLCLRRSDIDNFFLFNSAEISSYCRLARTIIRLPGTTKDFLATCSACLHWIKCHHLMILQVTILMKNVAWSKSSTLKIYWNSTSRSTSWPCPLPLANEFASIDIIKQMKWSTRWDIVYSVIYVQ